MNPQFRRLTPLAMCFGPQQQGSERSKRQSPVLQLSPKLMAAIEAGRTRLLVTGMVFSLAFATLGARLIDVTLFERDGTASVVQRAVAAKRVGDRADIVDRNGIVLATSLPTASLYANPQMVRSAADAARRIAAVIPGASEAELRSKLSSKKSFVWLKRQLTPTQQYQVNRLGIPGLQFQKEFQRYYPHGALLSHTVGFAGLDNQGLSGIEQYFDKRLREEGTPLALSIDIRMQFILTQELAKAMQKFNAIGATGTVLDVRSGEVLALSSLPSFEPTAAASASDDARFNRATLGLYEMGSVFKIFTTAMALDQGFVDFDDGYDTSKPIRAARYTIRDYKPKNRWLSIPEIFIYSSNIGTVHMAMEAGTGAQRAFLKNIGLLSAPSLEVSEVGAPLLPSPWREINTMTISYGHGLAVSPLQVAAAVSSIVNGGELHPLTLVRRASAEDIPARRVISEKTSRQMRQLMRLTVTNGTGRKADAEGYFVGGKTGTADKQAGKGYARNKRIASFVGAFPMTDPRYVVLVMLDEPKGIKETHGYATGGWVAAPVMRGIVERIGPIAGLAPRGADQIDDGTEQILVRIKANAEGHAIASN